MSIVWQPVIEVFESGALVGHVHLPHQSTEALPRIGEFVGFEESEVCNALKLQSSISYVPVVTAVHHSIDRAGGLIRVHIKMGASRTAEQMTAIAKRDGIEWQESPL